MTKHVFWLLGALAFGAGAEVLVTDKRLDNEAAYLPPQCYTKTDLAPHKSANPCFACHIGPKRPNFIEDRDLQASYALRDYTQHNHWDNLFRDFSKAVAAQSDAAILAYVRTDNYHDGKGGNLLADKLKALPAEWDFNGNGRWDGYLPDVAFHFDDQGFDRRPDGKATGWRAFGYYPFLGAFAPTNGATDDVLIRLPKAFREDVNGNEDLALYRLNLAVLEAMIKEQDIPIAPVDEKVLGLDLDKDGELGTATRVTYDWAPNQGRQMHYLGLAGKLQDQGKVKMAAGLYPVGTEFVHTVRYLDFDQEGRLRLSARLKELRYSRKLSWNNYAQLSNAAISEVKATHDFPDRLRTFRGNAEQGINGALGWVYQGFIEDAKGALRPQSFEENLACMGCHTGISATTDGTFAFPRKFGAGSPQDGWYHWSQVADAFKDVPEPRMADGRLEYRTYLAANDGWGDEFRGNLELRRRFLTATGRPDQEMLDKMSRDISLFLVPSKERALSLNKAYRALVEEQSFSKGRDPHVQPLENVHRDVAIGTATGNAILGRRADGS
ncbi:hypothetical protein PVT67_04685 [Gallaecimonas kandeliae]|uniref:hypothetical protein n=1 Tax=Gallaecimonas kandeliae TaxID=3029055 RepID=UPI002648F02A|nr:hypothetical protein [Gallaecimonas kandeliae]WKE66551.1 hypothetical protein PVT67_04685 [Gallaecimonas kandeliae]